MTPIDASLLSAAIVIWTEWEGDRPWPLRDEASLVDRLGPEMAAELLPRLQMLEKEFYESDAVHRAWEIPDVGELAAKDFRKRHPEITEEAVQALTWCYMYDNK